MSLFFFRLNASSVYASIAYDLLHIKKVKYIQKVANIDAYFVRTF